MLTMEFLSYSLEDRGSMFLDSIELSIDVLARNKNLVKNLDMKDLCDFDKNMMGLDGETVDGIGFLETVFPKSVLGSACFGDSNDEMTDSLINKEPSSSMINLDHFAQELRLGAELSVTASEPNNEKESMIDLQLEKCNDSKEGSSVLSSKQSMISSLMEESPPAKRVRTTNLYPHNPVCQVQGCYKDLSSSKDYHKRHRVCDIHSKTAKVIINGIEQRFCQQCSRFHLLSEFEDGKRSCRKRLAGHNERRRKSQFGAPLGSRFYDMTSLKSASFLSPETLGGGFWYQESNLGYNHSKHLKLEPVSVDISELPVTTNGQFPKESLLDLHIMRNWHHPGTCNDATVVSAASGALSLLSTKSHKPSSHSMGFSMMTPPSTRENQDACIRTDQKSATQLGKSTIKTFASNRHLSSWRGNQAEIPMVHDSRASACSVAKKDGFLQTSDYDNYIRCISPEFESTVNLLQLSSHLQRVEHLRRNSYAMKQENHTSC